MCPTDRSGRATGSPAAPSRTDSDYFTDAAELSAPAATETAAELSATLLGLFRAELSGSRPGALVSTLEAARGAERERLLHALADGLSGDVDLARQIAASDDLYRRAANLVLRIAPRDLSNDHNGTVRAALAGFTDWGSYPYQVIIVPGYTPLNAKVASPGVHPVAMRRLEQAVLDFKDRKAPFVLVSGANVYPSGTPYFEAIEMKKALLSMGMDEERVIVEARARHSTTNLRNAGRIMLEQRMRIGVITTMGGGVAGSDLFDQDFYFSNPTLSTFHGRCESELGYKVGELRGAGDGHTDFIPSASVRRWNYRDPLDP